MRLLLVLAAFGVAACGPEFMVVPHGGAPRVTAVAQTGPTMTAFANQWEADPYDLADYVTPIAVELYNPGPYDVRVAYSDFALTDPRGTRYPAINPYLPAAAVSQIQHKSPFAPVLLAQRTVGPPSGTRGGGGMGFSGPRGGGGFGRAPIPSYGRGFSSGVPSGRRIYGPGYSGGIGLGFGSSWNRYHVYGGLRGFYGSGALYWGGPFIYPPTYADWVFWWGPSYYPSARPSPDILMYGLPEGVLPPGGKVDGYLYFKKATSRENRNLDLRWDISDARTGASLGNTHVALEVLER
jgi:hypothetical protein